MNQLEKRWRDGDLRLFPHQWTGVEEMEQWFKNGHGGICADEMGLGKTCTTIVTMTRQLYKHKGPYFVLSPLSVCEHWEREIKKFSGGHLEPFRFTGYESARQKALDQLKFNDKTVFITSGHILRQQSTLEILRQLQKKKPFATFVIDEAQCVKNPEAQLTRCLKSIIHRYANPRLILLTGTPIQNNLGELYALLTLSDPLEFPPEKKEEFINQYTVPENMPELKEMLKKYMFRRTKEDVFKKELKDCEQVILYHGISELQKEVYKNTLTKNAGLLRSKRVCASLTTVFTELRKCVIHPYIIPGVEPEPFIEGEHLVDASGKLQVLDRLLKYMIPRGHRALIFSQFLGALDIIEDLLFMRGWKYVRISGTTRIEDRVEFVEGFQDNIKNGPVCFLLSTKAGGVGLNLTAADTAIFFDSDWNPQNDIQAMARCHRIGQTKPVKIIRLVGRSTIDQYVVATAREKLKLTDAIIGGPEIQLAALDVVDSLQRDFETLMNSKTDKFECTDEELEQMIGGSSGDAWLPIEKDSNVVRFLDPNDHDQDIDRNDYTKWEGASHKDATYTDIWESIVAGNHELPAKRRRSVANYGQVHMLPSTKQMLEAEKQMMAERKKPTNGYLLFVQEEKTRIVKEHPQMPSSKIMSLYSTEWAKLTAAEQDAYAVRAGRVKKEKEPPKNAFQLFRSIQEPILKKQGIHHTVMLTILSEKWRALTAAERRKYQDTIIWGPQEDGPTISKPKIVEVDDDSDELDRDFQHLGE